MSAPKFTPCARCGHSFAEHRFIDPAPWYWRRCSVPGCKCHAYKRGRAAIAKAEGRS